jgi:hypothetical protein
MNGMPQYVLLDAFNLLASLGKGPYFESVAKHFPLTRPDAVEILLTANLPPVVAGYKAAGYRVRDAAITEEDMRAMSQPAQILPRCGVVEGVERLMASYQVGIFCNASMAYMLAFQRMFPDFRKLPSFWSCEMGHLVTSPMAIHHVQQALCVKNPADIMYISNYPHLDTAASLGWQVRRLDSRWYANAQAPLQDLLPYVFAAV